MGRVVRRVGGLEGYGLRVRGGVREVFFVRRRLEWVRELGIDSGAGFSGLSAEG